MFTCLYKVKCYFDNTEYIDNGVLYTNTFAEAAAQLEDFYGCELIEITYMEMFDTPHLLLPPELFEQVRNYLNSDLT